MRGGLEDRMHDFIDVINERNLNALCVSETKRKVSDEVHLPGGLMVSFTLK